MNDVELWQGDCLELMKDIPDEFIDLTVTSPPYDNLRTYNGNINQWSFEKFQEIAKELYRVTTNGGVVVWIVNDATIKGSETGTSFKQALWFKECGFNLWDTMIWQKTNPIPNDTRQNRYIQAYEYMFIFSKGKPRNCNYLIEKTKCGGKITNNTSQIKPNGNSRDDRRVARRGMIVNEYKIRTNIWSYSSIHKKEKTAHPAQFPEQLANDHIISWSNEGDIILDPFMGSGSTGVACKNLNRNFIGMELDENYFKIAEDRIENYKCKENLF